MKKERECGVRIPIPATGRRKQFSFEAVQNTHRVRVLSSQQIILLRTRMINRGYYVTALGYEFLSSTAESISQE